MAHHKRGRPKNRRAGCLLCKPHKANGAHDPRRQERRARIDARQQLAEAWAERPDPPADGA